MTEQENFEAWVKNPHMLDKSTSPDDCGKYTHPWTIGAWKGWQEAIASREPMPLEKAEEIAHIRASRYTHKSDKGFTAYTFLPHTLEDFVRKIERFHGIGE